MNTSTYTQIASGTQSVRRSSAKGHGVSRLETAFGVVLAATAGYTMWCVASFLFSMLQG